MSSELDPANLNALTVAQINLRLKEKGLATTGTKQIKLERLKAELLRGDVDDSAAHTPLSSPKARMPPAPPASNGVSADREDDDKGLRDAAQRTEEPEKDRERRSDHSPPRTADPENGRKAAPSNGTATDRPKEWDSAERPHKRRRSRSASRDDRERDRGGEGRRERGPVESDHRDERSTRRRRSGDDGTPRSQRRSSDRDRDRGGGGERRRDSERERERDDDRYSGRRRERSASAGRAERARERSRNDDSRRRDGYDDRDRARDRRRDDSEERGGRARRREDDRRDGSEYRARATHRDADRPSSSSSSAPYPRAPPPRPPPPPALPPVAADPRRSTNDCHQWREEGRCRYGDACKFVHAIRYVRGAPASPPRRAPPGWSRSRSPDRRRRSRSAERPRRADVPRAAVGGDEARDVELERERALHFDQRRGSALVSPNASAGPAPTHLQDAGRARMLDELRKLPAQPETASGEGLLAGRVSDAEAHDPI